MSMTLKINLPSLVKALQYVCEWINTINVMHFISINSKGIIAFYVFVSGHSVLEYRQRQMVKLLKQCVSLL